jgi:PhzF family phenazine biosynthesis protein
MPTCPVYLIDAFASAPFKGNVAAVCPLPEWPGDAVLQNMAIEHNQSETAYFVPKDDGYELRWFTVLGEINLCGHATLASAHVIFRHLNFPHDKVRFQTRFVGDLFVTRDGDWLTLDFPSWMPEPVAIPAEAAAAIGGIQPLEVHSQRDYLFLLRNAAEVRAVKPDYAIMEALQLRVCVTAQGDDCDIVSRFFCPGDAVPEDPVTGSAHSMLVPFWAARLGKTKMLARQLSARGGELHCELIGDRVMIAGQAVTYLEGQVTY